jgi:DNA mismatch endonuclease (patch repair protein)
LKNAGQLTRVSFLTNLAVLLPRLTALLSSYTSLQKLAPQIVFRMDIFTKEKRSKIMRAIKSKDTKEERLLAKALWRRGHRYRKHDRTVFGTPDLSFKKYRIAIFVDGEFFHGKDWESIQQRLDTNKEFWLAKIERNRNRDKIVNEYLASKGWLVLRFWSKDVKRKLYTTVRTIEKEIENVHKKIYFQDTPHQ